METLELVNPELIESTLKSVKEALKFLREKKKKTKNDLLSIEYLRSFINSPTPVNYILISCGRADEMKRKEEAEVDK